MIRLDLATTGARLGFGLWAILLTYVAVRVAVAPAGKQSVVPIYQVAGDRYLAGGSLYAPIPGRDAYRNPPGVAMLAVGLTALQPRLGEGLTRLIQVAVLLTGLRRALSALAPDWPASHVGWAFAVAAVLAAPAVNNGQLNVLVAGSLLHAAAAAHTKSDAEAAGWAALAAAVKIYPLAVGLLLCVARPRLVPYLAGALVLAGAAPYLGQSCPVVSAQYRAYYHDLIAEDRSRDAPTRMPRDWTCVPRTLLGAVVPARAAQAVGLGAAALAAALTLGAARRGFGVPCALVLGGTWMTAFGPATEANTYALLAGSVPLAVGFAPPSWPRRAAGVGLTLLLAPAARGAFPNDWKFTAHGPQPVGAILVAGGFCAAARRRP